MKNLFIIGFLVSSFLLSQDRIDVLNINNGDIIKGKIIENKINEYIRIELQGGSILTYKYSEIKEIGFEEVKDKISNKNSTSSLNRDCYQMGYNSAFGKSENIFLGVISGYALGLIGTGIAYAISTPTTSVTVPDSKYPKDAEDLCRVDFKNGYKDGISKKSKGMTLFGGLIGTLLVVATAS